MADALAVTYADSGLFIGGEWLGAEGRKNFTGGEPGDRGSDRAGAACVDGPISTGRWRRRSRDSRRGGRFFRMSAGESEARGGPGCASARKEIARIATTESGKSIHETRIEVMMSANFRVVRKDGARTASAAAAAMGSRMAVVRPVGPVAAFAVGSFRLGRSRAEDRLGAGAGAR